LSKKEASVADKKPPDKLEYCSFCNKSQHEVKKLIAGPEVFICDECIDLCNDIIRDELAASNAGKPAMGALPIPEEIVAALNEYVIGQSSAKKKLAVAARRHYLRKAILGQMNDGVEMEKSNVLLVGPSGSGKTYLAQTLAKILDVPYAEEDLTRITEAGYVGGNVEDVFVRLLASCDGDVAKAEFGIIYLDEVDKLGRTESAAVTRDVGGGAVQQALLKILEGTTLDFAGGNRKPGGKGQEVNGFRTHNILFILGGAFEGIEKLIAKRVNKHASGIGFGADLSGGANSPVPLSLIHQITPDDLVHFGMDRQFIGRLPVRATLDELDEATLRTILTEPKNALLKQFALAFKLEGAALACDPEAVGEIARKALREKTGARGLRTICEQIFQETLYVLPTRQQKAEKVHTVHLTGEHVQKGLSPELLSETQKLLK
jgi:ATP-dependent Clp protease ATP-binding subunit ClpX